MKRFNTQTLILVLACAVMLVGMIQLFHDVAYAADPCSEVCADGGPDCPCPVGSSAPCAYQGLPTTCWGYRTAICPSGCP